MKKFLHWLPRILAILYIAFITMFALDVFGEPQWFLALIMHLIPTFILIILTIIAWKSERIGGVLFILAGLFALVFFGWEAYIIYIPTIVIAALFLLSRYLSRKY